MEYAYVYAVKERARGDGKERGGEWYNMRRKFSQVRRVERQEMVRSSWVTKDKEQKRGGGKAKERRKE